MYVAHPGQVLHFDVDPVSSADPRLDLWPDGSGEVGAQTEGEADLRVDNLQGDEVVFAVKPAIVEQQAGTLLCGESAICNKYIV